MNIGNIKFLAFASAFCASFGVSAAEDNRGDVLFAGSVVESSCVIRGGVKSFTVALPAAQVSQLAVAGATAGETAFSISLSSCSAGMVSAYVYFESGANVDPASGRLINAPSTASPAKNVQVEIVNGVNGNPVLMHSKVGSQNTGTVTIAAGSGTANYKARYYATGVATPGAFKTTFTYTLVYN